MQHLEVRGAVRPLKWSLGVKRLRNKVDKKREILKTQQTDETFPPLQHTRSFVPVKEASYFHIIQIHKSFEIANVMFGPRSVSE